MSRADHAIRVANNASSALSGIDSVLGESREAKTSAAFDRLATLMDRPPAYPQEPVRLPGLSVSERRSTYPSRTDLFAPHVQVVTSYATGAPTITHNDYDAMAWEHEHLGQTRWATDYGVDVSDSVNEEEDRREAMPNITSIPDEFAPYSDDMRVTRKKR